MKIKSKHLLITLLISFALLAIVSSASACMVYQERYDFDEGNKIFKIDNKKIHTSWNAYRYSQDKNSAIKVYKEYKVKNKKGKTVLNSDVYYNIEKVKKNRIKVTKTYSTGPPIDQEKIYKTKLSVRAFYWKYIETQFTSKIDKKIFSTESIIDKGGIKATLPYNNTYFKNVTKLNHNVSWKAKTYSKFPNVIYINQKYKNNDPMPKLVNVMDDYGSDSYDSYIVLEKIKKNVIKITVQNLYALNGDFINDKTYSVKTKLSLKKYFSNVFKSKMIKMFSGNVSSKLISNQ